MPRDRDDAQVWQLRSRGEAVARIHVHGTDQPWFVGTFEPGPEFSRLKPLFDREVAMVDVGGDLDVDVWEALQDRICRTVTLIKPDGVEVADFILHIRGDEATFRWSDEPISE